MAYGHELGATTGDHGAERDALHQEHGSHVLPENLSAPPMVGVWKTRSLLVAAVAAVVSVLFAFTGDGRDHILRAYLLGWMLCFGFCGGGLCFLMLQYVTGGKWGNLLRRPLEAMTRTLPLLVAMLVPLLIFGKRLWLWMRYPTDQSTLNALNGGQINEAQAHSLVWKRPMLSPTHVVLELLMVFAFMGVWGYFLNRWSVERDHDPNAGTQRSFEFWRIRSENLSGIGILLYVVMLSILVLDLVMSLDITWYSTMYGFMFLVSQGYGVLALGVHTMIRLSKTEPVSSFMRKTEQYDLGKFMLGFVMLNIYLTFAQFLIIWSANQPEEIEWYLHRTHGGWWAITSLDFIFHWVIPFCLLLSRSFKFDSRKMLALTAWMIFARAFDLFWLIEPNFPNAADNLHIRGNGSILAYVTVPVAVLGLWMWNYLTNLASRPLIVRNDPHTAEMLEAEHAH